VRQVVPGGGFDFCRVQRSPERVFHILYRLARVLWVDATYHKVRVNGRVISQATVVAVA
jgi:transposase-like protein